MDTSPDHLTLLALRVRGKNIVAKPPALMLGKESDIHPGIDVIVFLS